MIWWIQCCTNLHSQKLGAKLGFVNCVLFSHKRAAKISLPLNKSFNCCLLFSEHFWQQIMTLQGRCTFKREFAILKLKSESSQLILSHFFVNFYRGSKSSGHFDKCQFDTLLICFSSSKLHELSFRKCLQLCISNQDIILSCWNFKTFKTISKFKIKC